MYDRCLREVRNNLFLTDWALRLLQGPLVHDVPEHGQQEGYGFPAAGLSNADEVSARHDGRDCLGLDRGGLLVAVPGYIIHIIIHWRQPECRANMRR